MCFEINRVQLVHRGVQRGRCSYTVSFPAQRGLDADLRCFWISCRGLFAVTIENLFVKITKRILLAAGLRSGTQVLRAWNNQPQWGRMPSNVAS